MLSAKVASIWRYPVKSMIGEEVNACEITEKGLLGDRAYGVIDNGTGKLANAKNPHKWPNMFQHRATFIEPPQEHTSIPPVKITLPSGDSFVSTDDFIENEWVGKTLTIGDVQLKVSQETKRCVMTTLAQGDLPKDLNVLRSIVRNNAGSFGVYATVARTGRIRIEDRVEVY